MLGDYVLVPYHLVSEYNSVPENVFSPHEPFDQVRFYRICSFAAVLTEPKFVEKAITDINITSRVLIYSVRQDLTPSLGMQALISVCRTLNLWSDLQ
jgi:hypothetical protein